MTAGPIDRAPQPWLLCRIGRRLCGLPLGNVVEAMRLLPIEPIADAPHFVIGLSLVRGAPVPVVDIGALFGEPESQPQRMVTLDAGGRQVALVAQAVLGVRSLGQEASNDLPPLLREAAGSLVSAVGTLDAELLLFLRTARIMPEALLGGLAGARGAP
jgi:purine-binding chemotaxis protein CheW